jgi:hypothetical protein
MFINFLNNTLDNKYIILYYQCNLILRLLKSDEICVTNWLLDIYGANSKPTKITLTIKISELLSWL